MNYNKTRRQRRSYKLPSTTKTISMRLTDICDTGYCKELGKSPITVFALELKNITKSLPYQLQEKLLALISYYPTPRTLYMFPKIHKQVSPDRPVMSDCSICTEELLGFLQTILKLLLIQQTCFLQDTTDSLHKVWNLSHLSEKAILATLGHLV